MPDKLNFKEMVNKIIKRYTKAKASRKLFNKAYINHVIKV